jgi:hypothetical protein
MVAQTSFAGNRVFHPSTFGVLPAAERLAQARKALRDLAREQRKRARHAAEVAKLCPIFPAWPVPVAHVESRSRPGEFYTIDLEAQTCGCPARVYCAHLEAAELLAAQLKQADAIRAARERHNWRLLQANFSGALLHYEPLDEVA